VGPRSTDAIESTMSSALGEESGLKTRSSAWSSQEALVVDLEASEV
jgi:hypothetical protein